MNQTYKKSFLALLSFIFLLPIFFFPGNAFGLEIAKTILYIGAFIILTALFLFETWKDNKLTLPWHRFIVTALLLPLIYFLSAFLVTPSSLSLLGYNFETGTFGYILLGSFFLLLSSIIFIDATRLLKGLVAFFVTISILGLFSIFKILIGGNLSVFGNFAGNMGNPVGNWTDLAVLFGLLVIFTTLVLSIVPIKSYARTLAYGVYIAGLFLLIVINFPMAFVLILGSSIFLVLYFQKIERRFPNFATSFSKSSTTEGIYLSVLLGIVSIIFLINPTIPVAKKKLGEVVAETFKIQNIDVRPSLSTTINISKEVLSKDILFGSGPNTFEHDWLIYKPASVNATPFWQVVFPFGTGFLLTQIASIGIVGTILWIAFFAMLTVLSVKIFNRIPDSRKWRFTLIATLCSALFLWIATLLYSPSRVMLMFAFIFTGLLIAAARQTEIVVSRTFELKNTFKMRFLSTVALVVIVIGTLVIGWAGYERAASAFYFKKAVDLSNKEDSSLDQVEDYVNKAVAKEPFDVYYVALSRVNFVRAQKIANAGTGTPEQNRANFEEAVKKSIAGAQNAVRVNPLGYQNWATLGIIYSALVPPPLSVNGAYENARLAYNEAMKRNPANPELSVLASKLELSKGNKNEARLLLRNAISLKPDYIDAYLMLAQLEVSDGNVQDAIASVERAAAFTPDNSGVYFELGVLQYANKRYDDAVNAFLSAIKITPEYANAKYYLGLSFLRMNKPKDALEQFESLLATNPDNQDLKSLIKDIKSGKRNILK